MLDSGDNSRKDSGADSSSSDRSGTSLDLGLEELLRATEAEKIAEEPANTVAEPAAAESNPEPDTSADEPPDPYRLLADEGRWRELADLSEEKLALDPEGDLPARLWWIKSQLALDEMPRSLLSAPLDSAAAQLEQQLGSPDHPRAADLKQLTPLASKLLMDTAADLKLEHDFTTAELFLARCSRLGTECATQRRELLEAEENYIVSLEDPIRREALAPRLAELRREIRSTAPGTPKDAQQSQPQTAATAGATIPKRERSERRALPQAAIILLALCFAAYGGWSYWFDIPQTNAHPPRLLAAELGQSRLPEVSRSARINALDMLLYDLEKNREAESVSRGAEGDPPPAAEAGVVKQVSSDSAPNRNVLGDGTRQKVNTSGPIEPPRERRQGTRRAEPPRGRSPFDSQPTMFPEHSISSGLEVQQFPVGRVYRLKFRSPVHLTPSHTAPVIAELQAGDTVYAEGKVGDFLRLRAKHGRTGYILEGDLEEVGGTTAQAKR